METLTHILNGFSVCLQPINLWYTFLGVFMGTIIGVLPGIGPAAGIALLIPVTYGMNPTSALIMMCGIYYGTKYGGSTTAILIRTPGRSRLGHDLDRRLRDGEERTRRRGAGGVGDRLVHRRHPRRGGADVVRVAAGLAGAQVRSGRVFLPDGVRHDRGVIARRQIAGEGHVVDHAGSDDRDHRHRPAKRPAALHHGRAGVSGRRRFRGGGGRDVRGGRSIPRHGGYL